VSHANGEHSPRCTHCGRPVGPTAHTRDGWRVDHYVMHSGEVEPAVYRRDEFGPPIEYLRLVSYQLVITCSECYARPEIRRTLLFPEEGKKRGC
jgi:hypothetical protein